MRNLCLMVLLLVSIGMFAQAPLHPSSVQEVTPVKLPGGVVYWDLNVGTGKTATLGSKVKVNYTGWLLEEGTKFDSSYDHDGPMELTLGSGEVIKGWEQGLVGMKVGGKRQLRIPPELAYGYRGHPPSIPHNAYLIFDVEMLEVK